jgi:hypothetical protein
MSINLLDKTREKTMQLESSYPQHWVREYMQFAFKGKSDEYKEKYGVKCTVSIQEHNGISYHVRQMNYDSNIKVWYSNNKMMLVEVDDMLLDISDAKKDGYVYASYIHNLYIANLKQHCKDLPVRMALSADGGNIMSLYHAYNLCKTDADVMRVSLVFTMLLDDELRSTYDESIEQILDKFGCKFPLLHCLFPFRKTPRHSYHSEPYPRCLPIHLPKYMKFSVELSRYFNPDSCVHRNFFLGWVFSTYSNVAYDVLHLLSLNDMLLIVQTTNIGDTCIYNAIRAYVDKGDITLGEYFDLIMSKLTHGVRVSLQDKDAFLEHVASKVIDINMLFTIRTLLPSIDFDSCCIAFKYNKHFNKMVRQMRSDMHTSKWGTELYYKMTNNCYELTPLLKLEQKWLKMVTRSGRKCHSIRCKYESQEPRKLVRLSKRHKVQLHHINNTSKE